MLRLSPEQAQMLYQAVQTAQACPDLASKINQIYAEIQSQIDDRKPRCDISGRCCRFDEYGHKLFVTTLELALFMKNLNSSSPSPLYSREESLTLGQGVRAQLAILQSSSAVCPYQKQNLCTVHPIRPFGCRIYFCDPTAQGWQQDQYEFFHQKIKALHHELKVDYFYVEWLEALKAINLF